MSAPAAITTNLSLAESSTVFVDEKMTTALLVHALLVHALLVHALLVHCDLLYVQAKCACDGTKQLSLV